MTEKQKRIADLRKQLLAPIVPAKPDRPVAGGVNKLNFGARGEPDNKFNRVMDWGTPRLVTKSR